jgi:hypothetical protein
MAVVGTGCGLVNLADVSALGVKGRIGFRRQPGGVGLPWMALSVGGLARRLGRGMKSSPWTAPKVSIISPEV